jgi:hypothetical protein
MVPVCQSNVATWPFRPTIAICLHATQVNNWLKTKRGRRIKERADSGNNSRNRESLPATAPCHGEYNSAHLPLRVYLERYGPPSRTISFLPLAASAPTCCRISFCVIRHVLSISPSTSIFPASSVSRSSRVRCPSGNCVFRSERGREVCDAMELTTGSRTEGC